jgi:hypothetical protein
VTCSLRQYAKNVYSQNGEDGITAEIVRRLDIHAPGWFVEFGAGDGRKLSNTRALAEKNWCGVWIESDVESYAIMEQSTHEFGGRVHPLHKLVGLTLSDNLDAILATTLAPKVLDFISIDIDSFDYEVWESMVDYRAKIVLIEINSGVPVGVHQRHGKRAEGTSFTTMVDLGQKKGYQLVCHTGNLYFVDERSVRKLELPEHEMRDPNTIFDDTWVRWAQQAPR